LIATGGLRKPADFVKALALGADAVALSNAPMQAIGCLGMRACNTNNCPVGVATQKDELRARLDIELSARQLERFLSASVDLMKVLARACGHDHLSKFEHADLVTWKAEMAALSGVAFGGVGAAGPGLDTLQ
ncbi:MAG: glutamate synthase-related protein, partial [Pseudomonadota bacterium]